MAMFGLMFLLYSPVWAVENRALPAHLGIGAFNLVRASVFRAIGGLSRLALSVDDDMRLGQALKFAGYSTRVLLGHGAVSVRWQVGLGGMIRGLEKNFFAGLTSRWSRCWPVRSGCSGSEPPRTSVSSLARGGPAPSAL